MGSVTVAVRDQTTRGDVLAALDVQLVSEHVTVRELIRARVHQEVRSFNAEAGTRGVGELSAVERALNNGTTQRKQRVDAERQTEIALDGFRRGHVLLLVGDRQIDDIDEELTLSPSSSVTFLRLVPLAGG